MVPTAPAVAQGEMPEAAPPQYTERVEPETVTVPRSDDEASEIRSGGREEGTRGVPRVEPTTGGEQDEGSGRLEIEHGEVTATSVSQRTAGENPVTNPQEEQQQTQAKLDLIAETIQ